MKGFKNFIKQEASIQKQLDTEQRAFKEALSKKFDPDILREVSSAWEFVYSYISFDTAISILKFCRSKLGNISLDRAVTIDDKIRQLKRLKAQNSDYTVYLYIDVWRNIDPSDPKATIIVYIFNSNGSRVESL